MKKKIIFLVIIISILFGGYGLAQAQILPDASGEGCLGGKEASECGNYELNDMVQLVVNVSRFVLGLVGSLSLVMFIYGGIVMMTSGGSEEKVSKGRKVLSAALIGLIIVFSSYLIIKFILGSMGLQWEGRVEKLQAKSAQEFKL